jgi:hypothetical protein
VCGAWLDGVDLVAAATAVELPALALQYSDEFFGGEPGELVAHAAAGASLRCSILGRAQPCSSRDSR